MVTAVKRYMVHRIRLRSWSDELSKIRSEDFLSLHAFNIAVVGSAQATNINTWVRYDSKDSTSLPFSVINEL